MYKLMLRINHSGKFMLVSDNSWCEYDYWTLQDYDHHVYWRAIIRLKRDNKVIREFLKIKDKDTFLHNIMMFDKILTLEQTLKGQ